MAFSFKESGLKDAIAHIDKVLLSIETQRRETLSKASKIVIKRSKELSPEFLSKSIDATIDAKSFTLIANHQEGIRQHEDLQLPVSDGVRGPKFFKRAMEQTIEPIGKMLVKDLEKVVEDQKARAILK